MTAQQKPQKFPRLGVRWTIHVSEHWNHPAVSSETENVSGEAFYFRSEERFAPGEELEGVVLIPAFDPENSQRALNLCCSFRVIAVEPLEREGMFGVECHILSYSARRNDLLPCDS